jgi:hypothetical protein
VSSNGDADDRVLGLTRAVAWFVAPFLVVGFAVLWPVPTDTGALFAWRITSTVMAMTLGAAYLGGAYFFVRAARATRWHTIKGGFLPVTVFATLLGIATVLHWDKFNHRHVAFWLWTGLYFSTPLLVALVYLRNRRHEPPAADGEPWLPVTVAWLIGGVAVLALTTGLWLFATPETAIRYWPWPLTLLTARVLGAVFCLGLAGIGAFVDRRWTSARIPLQVAFVMLALIVVAGVRAHAELAAGNALTWAIAAGLGALTIAVAALYAGMERRHRVVRSASRR